MTLTRAQLWDPQVSRVCCLQDRDDVNQQSIKAVFSVLIVTIPVGTAKIAPKNSHLLRVFDQVGETHAHEISRKHRGGKEMSSFVQTTRYRRAFKAEDRTHQTVLIRM